MKTPTLLLLVALAAQATPRVPSVLDIVEQPQRACCAAIAVNDDGRLLATTSGTNQVTLWDLDTGLELRTLTAEPRTIPHRRDEAISSTETDTFRGLTFDPSGRYVALTAVDFRNPRTFDRPRRLAVPQVWAVDTGRDLSAGEWALDASTQHIANPAFAFDPAETLFWQITRDPAVASKLARYRGEAKAFSPDGTLGVTFALNRGPDSYAYLLTALDVASSRELWAAQVAGSAPPVVTFSPDSRWAVISAQTSQRVVDARTGAPVADLTSQKVGTAAAFSRDARRFVAVGGSSARVLSVPDWQPVREIRVVESDRLLTVTFTADGARVIAGGDQGIHVWDAVTGREIGRIAVNGARPVRSVALGRQRWLAIGTDQDAARSGGDVILWDWSADATFPRQVWHEEGLSIRSIAFSPDEQRMGVVSFAEDIGRQRLEGNISVCTLPACRQRTTLLTDRQEVRQGNYDVIREAGATNVVFTNDGATIIAAVLGLSAYRPAQTQYREFGSFSQLAFYDVRTLRRRRVVEKKNADISALALSPDGRLLATGHDHNTLRLWRAATGSERGVFRWPLSPGPAALTNSITGLAFHPDGRRLAITRDDGLAVLDTLRGTRKDIPVRKELGYSAVSYSPDGSVLIASGTQMLSGNPAKARISAWDSITLKERWSIEFAGRGVSQLVFEATGKWFAAATTDGVSLHDAATGARIMTLATLATGDWLAWTPDARYAGTPAGIARLAATRQGRHAVPLSAVGREVPLKDLITQVLR